MLKRTILLTSALVGVELLVMPAQAGGMGNFHMPRTVNAGTRTNCPPGMAGRTTSGGTNIYAPVSINNNINRATNINVNKSLNVYNP